MGDSILKERKRKNGDEVESHNGNHRWWREVGDSLALSHTAHEFLHAAEIAGDGVLSSASDSSLGGAINTVGKYAAPVTAVSGFYEVVENLGAKNKDAEKITNAIAGGAETTSGMIGTLLLMGVEAPALAAVGSVAGAGAGGYKLGKFLDHGADWIGDKITGNEEADHSISALLADKMFEIIHGRNGPTKK
ncbi:MAG: hypothetical protein ACREEM_40160 [Blastocatellia bacterium]